MVSKALDDAIKRAPKAVMQPDVVSVPSKKPKPTVMVIGGTGFIGRSLTRDLVSRGRDVRVFSRGSNGPFGDIASNVEVFSGSLHSADDLARAMQGIDVVYHLAKSMDDTWEDCLKNDVGVTVKIAQAAIDAGVKRFIYTGTIASYDMSEPSQIIRDDTPFDDDMSDRNLYARSKAACEAALLDLHDKQGLPLVIARPGIVLGKGGPLQHWGIGRWQGAGTVRIWGDGHNKLPFVLIDDVCDGMIRMIDTDDAVGKAFNLVGAPMMTARDYFAAIQSELGARIVVKSGWLPAFFGVDAVKYVLKRHALGRKQAVRASLKDWKSRAHFSAFDISQSQEILGWTPIQDRAEFVKRAIVEADLFGF